MQTKPDTIGPMHLFRYEESTFLFNDIALAFLRRDEIRKTGTF